MCFTPSFIPSMKSLKFCYILGVSIFRNSSFVLKSSPASKEGESLFHWLARSLWESRNAERILCSGAKMLSYPLQLSLWLCQKWKTSKTFTHLRKKKKKKKTSKNPILFRLMLEANNSTTKSHQDFAILIFLLIEAFYFKAIKTRHQRHMKLGLGSD